MHAALRSAAGALLVLLGLLCGGDPTCHKQRKRSNAGQQRLLFILHQALSSQLGVCACHPR